MTSPDTDDLFERYPAGRLSPEEKRLLADRLEADPALQKEFVEHLQWSALLARGAAQQAAEGRGQGTTRRLRHAARFRPTAWIAAAAMLLLALGAYLLTGGQPSRRPVEPARIPAVVQAPPPRPEPPAVAPVPAPPFQATPPPPAVAVVLASTPPARCVRDGAAVPLVGDRTLAAGDRIETGGGGEAVLRYLDDDTRLRVGPGTRMLLSRRGEAKQVELRAGAVTAEVARQPDGRPMTFATPHAEATVLGTRLALVVDPELSRLDVSEGRVRLARPPDQAVVVGAGEYAIASDWEPLRVRKSAAPKRGLSEKLVPAEGCLWGVSLKLPATAAEGRQALAAHESKAGRKMALVHQYCAFPDATGTRKPFPGDGGMAWAEDGRLLMVSLKPRVGNRTITWADVAAGRHDAAYVDPAARQLAAWGRRCFFTLHHQPDDDIGPAGSGMTAADFVAMWRHVRARFDAAGASNVVWVWTVISGTPDASTWDALYPGNDQVDWLACGSFNYQPGPWRTLTASTQAFRDWFGRAFAGGRAKPVMLCVVACAEREGDPAAKEAWFRSLPAEVAAMPEVKGVVYWHSGSDAGLYAVDSSPEALAGYRAAGLDPVFNPD